MSNNNTAVSRYLPGVLFAVLFAVAGLAACGGGGGGGSATTPAPTSPMPATVESVAAAWAAEPMRAGTVHYFCDCGTGASGSCVAGNNTNAGTSAAAPQQTLVSAVSTLNSMPSGDTVARCKGGAFNALNGFNITRSTCAAGTTCVDLREYSPTTFVGTAKPIINNAVGADVTLFTFNGNRGGVRFLNLKMVGDNGALGNRNRGFFFYNGAHDVTMGNLDMDDFDVGLYNAGGNTGFVTTTNIKLTGNRFTNIRTFGFLGAGVNADISYNYWDGSGSSTVLDHAIYLAGAVAVTKLQGRGHYARGANGTNRPGGPA